MTRTITILLLLLASVFAVPPLRAQATQACDQATLDVVGDLLHVKSFRDDGYNGKTAAIVAARCKPSPKDSNVMLVAVAYMLPGDPNPYDDQGDRRFVVAAVDTASNKVIRSFKGNIAQDATLQINAGNSFRLDTARYDLAPGVRAFGVVFAGANMPRGVDGGWEDEYLILFAPNQHKLRPVFFVPLEQVRPINGESCENGPACWDVVTLTIGVAKSRSHGFADLSITETAEDGTKSRSIVHYDGSQYDSGSDRSGQTVSSFFQ